jgi:hypothetical protein
MDRSLSTGSVARKRPWAQRYPRLRADRRVGVLFDWREVALRECAARAGLQITLEARRHRSVGKLHRDENAPGALSTSVPRWTLVVPPKSVLNAASTADIVTRRIPLTSEDVDEALAGAFHDKAPAAFHAPGKKCRQLRERVSRWDSRYARAAYIEWRQTGGNCVVRLRLRETRLARRPTSPAPRASSRQPPRDRYSLRDTSRAAGARPSRSSPEGRAKAGWEAGIRTPITWSRATCPTVERPPSRRNLAGRGANLDYIGPPEARARRVGSWQPGTRGPSHPGDPPDGRIRLK